MSPFLRVDRGSQHLGELVGNGLTLPRGDLMIDHMGGQIAQHHQPEIGGGLMFVHHGFQFAQQLIKLFIVFGKDRHGRSIM